MSNDEFGEAAAEAAWSDFISSEDKIGERTRRELEQRELEDRAKRALGEPAKDRRAREMTQLDPGEGGMGAALASDALGFEVGRDPEAIAIKNRDWATWTSRMRTDWTMGKKLPFERELERKKKKMADQAAREAERSARMQVKEGRNAQYVITPKHVDDCTLEVCAPGCTYNRDKRRVFISEMETLARSAGVPGRPSGGADWKKISAYEMAKSLDLELIFLKDRNFGVAGHYAWEVVLGDSWFTEAELREAHDPAGAGAEWMSWAMAANPDDAPLPLFAPLKFISMTSLHDALMAVTHCDREARRRFLYLAARVDFILEQQRRADYNEECKRRRREKRMNVES